MRNPDQVVSLLSESESDGAESVQEMRFDSLPLLPPLHLLPHPREAVRLQPLQVPRHAVLPSLAPRTHATRRPNPPPRRTWPHHIDSEVDEIQPGRHTPRPPAGTRPVFIDLDADEIEIVGVETPPTPPLHHNGNWHMAEVGSTQPGSPKRPREVPFTTFSLPPASLTKRQRFSTPRSHDTHGVTSSHARWERQSVSNFRGVDVEAGYPAVPAPPATLPPVVDTSPFVASSQFATDADDSNTVGSVEEGLSEEEEEVEAMSAGSRALSAQNISSGGGLWSSVTEVDMIELMRCVIPWADAADISRSINKRRETLANASLWDTAEALVDEFPLPTNSPTMFDIRIDVTLEAPTLIFGPVLPTVTVALARRVNAYAMRHQLQAELESIEELGEGAVGLNCSLCFELHHPENTVDCESNHSATHFLCRPCFSMYVQKTFVENGGNTDLSAVPCCAQKTESCYGLYSKDQVRTNLNSYTFYLTEEKQEAKMRREAIAAVLRDGDVIELECDCGVVAVIEKTRVIQCPGCEKRMCTQCRNEYHGEGLCPASKQMAKVLQESNTSRCPGCGQAVTKVGGCDHMTCRCGTHFCLRCGREFMDGTHSHPGCLSEAPDEEDTREMPPAYLNARMFTAFAERDIALGLSGRHGPRYGNNGVDGRDRRRRWRQRFAAQRRR